DEDRLYFSSHPDSASQGAAICSHQGRLAGRIHIGQQDGICLAQNVHEIFKTVTSTRIAMRLERQDNPPIRPCSAGGLKSGRHLDRVMTVVVDQGETSAPSGFRHRKVSDQCETASDAMKSFKCFRDGLIAYTQLSRHCDSSQGIENVMLAGQAQTNRQSWKRAGHTATLYVKRHGGSVRPNIYRAHQSLVVEAIGCDRPCNPGADVTDAGVIA